MIYHYSDASLSHPNLGLVVPFCMFVLLHIKIFIHYYLVKLVTISLLPGLIDTNE